MGWFKDAFTDYPELAVFLTLGFGFLLGRLPLGKGIALGLVPGTLIVGLVVGDVFELTIPKIVSNIFFLLFLFAIGYRVGPQFFRGLRSEGLPQAAVAVVVSVVGLGTTYAVAKILDFNPGEAGGLLAGGLSQSAALGPATDAINQLSVSADEKSNYLSLLAIGYAVTYIFGEAGVGWWAASVAPKLFRFDLRAECAEMEAELGRTDEPDVAPAYYAVVQRAYEVVSDRVDGRTVAELEQVAAGRGHRAFAVRIRRDGQVLEAAPDTVIRRGDVVAVTGRREAVLGEGLDELGTETDDPALLDYRIESVGVAVTNKELDGRTVADLRSGVLGRGVFVDRLVRAGIDVPWTAGTEVHRGDELHLTGLQPEVERAGRTIGFVERSTPQTDMVFVSLGIVLGGLIGIPAITIGSVTLRLTTSVGALLAGLVFGWLRSVHPTFGRVPPAAQWFFDTVAFALSVGVIGINAGQDFVHGLRESGVSLLLSGIVVSLVPVTVGMVVARYVFHLRPPIMLGTATGGQTATAALGAITETARSQVPVLGYTVPYAVSNVLLTIWGTVIIFLIA
jgi:putative transport protein